MSTDNVVPYSILRNLIIALTKLGAEHQAKHRKVCPFEAQLVLLIRKEAIVLVNKRPHGIEITLRRIVVLIIALLAGGKEQGARCKEQEKETFQFLILIS